MNRIVIDAGHGGTSREGNSTAVGVVGPGGLHEKDVTLDIARHVASHFGERAELTRATDTNLSLAGRAHAANGAKVFVSIHANGGSAHAEGPETYVHQNAGLASRQLAAKLQTGLEQLSPGRFGGGGTREAPMALLNPSVLGSETAACLVEVDYLSNPEVESRLRDPQERRRIGGAIAEGILAHLGTGGAGFGLSGSGYAEAKDTVLEPSIPSNVHSLGDVNRYWDDLIQRYARWRTPVANTTGFPHSAICHLSMTDGEHSYSGTGFFIGRNKLLTAAHNFKDVGGYEAVSVTVTPGRNAEAGANESPFGSRRYTRSAWSLHPRYSVGHREFDMAVLRVADLPAPHDRFFSLANRSIGPNERIVVCGYGGNPVTAPRLPSHRQYMDGATVSRAAAETVFYPIHTAKGHSGSPVFVRDGADMMVIAVHVSGAGGDALNQGCLLNPDKLDWVNRV